MAHVTTLPNGKVLVDCPECGKTRDAAAFTGNSDHASGCRKKVAVDHATGKPANAAWTDTAYKCPNCATGRFITTDHTTGKDVDRGPCFRCKGKGYQTWADVKRNQSYDGWMGAKMMRGDANAQTKEIVKALGVEGPSKEEKEVNKPVKKRIKKPKQQEPCGYVPDEFSERDLFDSDEAYAEWKDGAR